MPPPKTKEEFQNLVQEIEIKHRHYRPAAFAIGLMTYQDKPNFSIEYLTINIDKNFGTAAVILHLLTPTFHNLLREGNAAQILEREEVSKILRYFHAFEGEPGHANIEALNKCAETFKKNDGQNVSQRDPKPIIIFLSDLDGEIADNYFVMHFQHCLANLPQR